MVEAFLPIVVKPATTALTSALRSHACKNYKTWNVFLTILSQFIFGRSAIKRLLFTYKNILFVILRKRLRNDVESTLQCLSMRPLTRS